MPGTVRRGRGPAVAAAVLALLCTLPLLWAAVIIWALAGLDTGAGGWGWALLPAGAAVLLAAGAVQLLRRRSRGLLAAASALAAVLVAWQLARAAADGNRIAVAMAVLLVALLGVLGLCGSPAVRDHVATRTGPS